MSEYIDIGVNLTGSSFREDMDEVIQRAKNSGVVNMLVTGTNIEHSKRALMLCKSYPAYLYATAGVHPHHASEFTEEVHRELLDLSVKQYVVAIGECGLDYNRNYSEPEQQRSAFEKQLQIAVETGLPVFLHQRDAHDDFVAILENYIRELSGGVAHCFTGNTREAEEYIEMGLHLGITGWLCDERRAGALREAVAILPVDKVMIETDAPYLLPKDSPVQPVQSRRNEPCFLPHICKTLARYMNIDTEELAYTVLNNTRRFFNLNQDIRQTAANKRI